MLKKCLGLFLVLLFSEGAIFGIKVEIKNELGEKLCLVGYSTEIRPHTAMARGTFYINDGIDPNTIMSDDIALDLNPNVKSSFILYKYKDYQNYRTIVAPRDTFFFAHTKNICIWEKNNILVNAQKISLVVKSVCTLKVEEKESE